MTTNTTIADVAIKIKGVTDRGAWTSSPTTSTKVTVPKGYHNGSGYVDTTTVYNAGYNSGTSKISNFTMVLTCTGYLYRSDNPATTRTFSFNLTVKCTNGIYSCTAPGGMIMNLDGSNVQLYITGLSVKSMTYN